jgi:hypothetical protein
MYQRNFCDDSRLDPPHPSRSNNHVRKGRRQFLFTENGSALHSDHGGWQPNQLPRRTHDKNNRPHHIKTNVEQCPQHRRRKVHVPRHQEFLLDYPPRSFRIHDNAAISLPILDKGTIQFGQARKERKCDAPCEAFPKQA